MKKIVLLPLDERPCNYGFPLLMPNAGYNLVLPPLSLLGLKKKPADTDKVFEWLKNAVKDADYAIVSMDTLIYGGLIPSRLHNFSEEYLKNAPLKIKILKEINPKIQVFAFQTIMRCPFYSLSDEEPDYYAVYGSRIHLYGKYLHKQNLGILTKDESQEFDKIKAEIDNGCLDNYISRRHRNLIALKSVIDLRKDKIIDELIIPQDDSARYGFTSLDQIEIRDYLGGAGLTVKVPVYPAADDTGMTLLARAVNDFSHKALKVYVYYASGQGSSVIPSFEDRSIDATVKNQILAAGCQRVYSLPECDIMIAVNIGSEMVYGDDKEKMFIPYKIERNLAEYIQQIKYALSLGKTAAVADVAYPSGSDPELIKFLYDEDLLLKIGAYAGWNTSSNTLGTVICQSVLYNIGKDDAGNIKFLLHRYYDDVGYCSHTRTWIDINIVPALNLTVFKLDGVRGKCSEGAKKELVNYMKNNFPLIAEKVAGIDVSMPWNRTFEAEIVLKTVD